MTNRDSSSERAPRPGETERPKADTVPGSDMQPEDAGTPASGNSGRGTAAEPALKQTSKTDAESGSRSGRE